MAKYRAIPQGFMTVGEVAKKMGVTVRTLQYYDKEGLLSPSAESEGGRRLYTDKDLVTLHQIISLKSLGFSLDDIKGRLISLETPADIANALTEQADDIRQKIEQLKVSLSAIEQLKAEVLQMQTVNFKKYADIIVNLQMENDSYYLIKRFDDDTLDHIRSQFDKESGLDFMDRFNRLSDEIIQLQKENVPPESEKCQQVVKEYWGLIMEFTNGDMSMLPKLMEVGNIDTATNAWEERQKIVNDYIGSTEKVGEAKKENSFRKKSTSQRANQWAAFMARRMRAASVLAVSSSFENRRSSPKRRLALPLRASIALRSQESQYICRLIFASVWPAFLRPKGGPDRRIPSSLQ